MNLQGQAVVNMQPHQAWNQIQSSMSTRAVCQAFMEGKEAVTWQQVAVRNNQAMSLHQIACLSQQELSALYQEYMDACKTAFPVVRPITLPCYWPNVDG